MSDLMLILRMGGETVALGTKWVEAVIEIEAVTPIPLAPRHVIGLAALRSRVLTIVDRGAAFGQAAVPVEAAFTAVIVPIDGHPYGIKVDEVVDVVAADGAVQDLRGPIDPAWARIAAGTVTIDGRLYVVIDPARLISGSDALAA